MCTHSDLINELAVWPLNSLIPLEEVKTRTENPRWPVILLWFCHGAKLNVVLFVERADRYSAAVRTLDFEGESKSGWAHFRPPLESRRIMGVGQ